MMLIEISPPLSIEEKENMSCEIKELLISARFMGHSLFPRIKFPTVVNVSIPIKVVPKIDDRFIVRTDIGEFYFSFIGELYSNFDDAVKNNLGIDK